MNEIDELLTELDSLEKVEVSIWYARNKMKLVAMIVESENDQAITIELIAQRIGKPNSNKTMVKKELESLCKLEIKKRNAQHVKDAFNINIAEAHTDKKGNLVADYHNLFLIGQTELWDKLRFDNFSGEVKVVSRLPWENHIDKPFEERSFQDHDVTEAVAWYNQFNINPKYHDVGHVLMAIAMRNSYDAYQTLMDAKPKWDGRRRLNTWLFRYCGSWPVNRKEWRIISAYGRKLFLSMVARCYDPGCMARLIFIFEGEQNIMKSLLVEAIGAPFYAVMSGKNLDLSRSDSHSVLNGEAMVEIPENVLNRKNDADTLKGYFSQRVSKVRLPWGKHHVELKRRNIFSITLNPGADKTHLNDPTGSTRYCPIECGVGKPIGWKIDLEGFKSVVDQLFAEAIHAYRNGEKWWLDSGQEQLQREHTDTRHIENPAEFFVAKYLSIDPRYKDEGISIDFVIQTLNKMDGCPRFSRQLVAEALKNLGFEQDRFTLTEEEKKVVTKSTRQVKLWFVKGTKLHIMQHRQSYGVSIYSRILSETW